MLAHLSLTEIALLIIFIVVSLVIHEFMHAYVGHLLGDTTAHEQGRMTLNPLSHIDPFMTIILPAITLITIGFPILAAKPVPFNPERVRYGEYGAAMLAAAGPFSNLLLAIIAGLCAKAFGYAQVDQHSILGTFMLLNVALFVFNILPIPPLDGSRVLYAFAPEPVQDFMRTIEPYGLFIIFGLLVVASVGFGSFLGTLEQDIYNLLP